MNAILGVYISLDRFWWTKKPIFHFWKGETLLEHNEYFYSYLRWLPFTLIFDNCFFAEDICFLPRFTRDSTSITINWLIFGIEMEN